MTIREQLLSSGYVRVFRGPAMDELKDVIITLQNDGHAAHFTQEVIDDRVTSAAGHHYLTCAQCRGTHDHN